MGSRAGADMESRLFILGVGLLLASPSQGGYEDSGYRGPAEKDGYAPNEADVNAEGNAENDPGMEGTSKACRYDDGPGWSDCDPFELVKYRVLHLVHGGSQCEDVKNITNHCTPHDFPEGTHWLIQEHRKCIAELNRLKAMIADLSKFIETIHVKGKELYAAYVKLKMKLDELTIQLDKLKMEGEHQQELLIKVKDDIEEWKSKARDLQVQLDELKTKYHDLEAEQNQLNLKNDQLMTEINVLTKENEGIEKKIEKLKRDNEDLRRKVLESEHVKADIADKKAEKAKLEATLDKLRDKLEVIRDDLAECKIKQLAKQVYIDNNEYENKDTHVDLSMEMFITHNKSTLYKPTIKPIYYSTEKYKAEYVPDSPKCLISYYGVTNETCWYESEGERSEIPYVKALGHHLVEAHWKYFTIDVKDQYECDKAAHLHYEFLLNRCSPKHYLPVLSVYRHSAASKELGTHVYPKSKADGDKSCWITFLGAHGHCEAHNNEFPLYNTADKEGSSKEACLAKAKWWIDYCKTPVIVTYVPEEMSTNWQDHWIMHDSHGGRMFEANDDTNNKINPDSLKPHSANPSSYKSEFKSANEMSPDYHDSPEYRKSLHLQGEEKEAMLESLRARLGMRGRAGAVGSNIKTFVGSSVSSSSSKSSEGYSSSSYSSSQKYISEKSTSNPYKEVAYEPETEAPYVEETEAPYEEETEAPYEEETEAPYEEETEAPYEEETEPPYEAYTKAPYVEETEAPYVEETEAPYEEEKLPYKPAKYVETTEAPYEAESAYSEAPKYKEDSPAESYLK